MTQIPDTTVVAIAGAGPAGLILAHLLRREGIPFVVLEKRSRDALSRQPKAGLIEYRTVQLLKGEGIAGPILDFPNENHRCEFRTPRGSAVLDYGELTGGRPHYVYPQHRLVQRLSDTLLDAGGEIRFGSTVRGVRQEPGGVTLSVTGPGGAPSVLRCEVAAGCEGAQSAVAAAMDQTRTTGQSLPARWLATIGAAPPLAGHTIYAAHPNGFAGHMRRGPGQTRYYLEVPLTDTVGDWPEPRVRDELSARLGAGKRPPGPPGAAVPDSRPPARLVRMMPRNQLEKAWARRPRRLRPWTTARLGDQFPDRTAPGPLVRSRLRRRGSGLILWPPGQRPAVRSRYRAVRRSGRAAMSSRTW